MLMMALVCVLEVNIRRTALSSFLTASWKDGRAEQIIITATTQVAREQLPRHWSRPCWVGEDSLASRVWTSRLQRNRLLLPSKRMSSFEIWRHGCRHPYPRFSHITPRRGQVKHHFDNDVFWMCEALQQKNFEGCCGNVWKGLLWTRPLCDSTSFSHIS